MSFLLQGLLQIALTILILVLSPMAHAQDFTQVGTWVSDELRISPNQRIALPPGQWRVAAFQEQGAPALIESAAVRFGDRPASVIRRSLTLANASRDAPLMLLVFSWTEGQTASASAGDVCERLGLGPTAGPVPGPVPGSGSVPIPGPWALKTSVPTESPGLAGQCALTDVFQGRFREQIQADAGGANLALRQRFSGLGAAIPDYPLNAVISAGALQHVGGDHLAWTVYANPERSGFNAPRDLSPLLDDERQQGLRQWMQELHQWQMRYLAQMARRFVSGMSFFKPPPMVDFMPSAMVSPAPALRMEAQGLPRVLALGPRTRLEGLALLTDSPHHGLMTVRSQAADEVLLEDTEGFVWHWLSGFHGVSPSVRNRAETRRIAAQLAALRPFKEGRSVELDALGSGAGPRSRHRFRVMRALEAHATPLGPRKVFELEHLEQGQDSSGPQRRTVYQVDAELPIPWSTQVSTIQGDGLGSAHREGFSIRSVHATPAFNRAQAGVALEGPAPTASLALEGPAPTASLAREADSGAPLNAAAASTPAASAPRDRLDAHALVIGNAAYPGAARLVNPVHDARAIGRKLEQFGFRVTIIEDASRDRLLKSMVDFKRTAAGSDLSLLFYAGHGAQIDGANYMVPLDVVSDDPEEVKIQAMNVAQVVDGFMPGRTRLVLLDACRNNPFLQVGQRGAQRGLAPMNVATGTLIAFATKSGSTAEDGLGAPHSPFTSALLQHLDEASDISLMLRRVRSTVMRATQGKQEPWEYGSLVGDELVLSRLAGR